ncbi:a171788d-8b4a-43a2-b718-ac40f90fb531 [Sclerotinia trifoliorum]|uniref:A171788d-8b4a-43a2-b718-ac40f90fb531 n=1 Tax=Sclerotinia trifoliorum TaxID=28548 RepID=A0A8H2VM28_9HELO|nr:a171788d-8b4a-43a2-b718-ac40f90fb531 [Sclerotinia trifoliorum]
MEIPALSAGITFLQVREKALLRFGDRIDLAKREREVLVRLRRRDQFKSRYEEIENETASLKSFVQATLCDLYFGLKFLAHMFCITVIFLEAGDNIALNWRNFSWWLIGIAYMHGCKLCDLKGWNDDSMIGRQVYLEFCCIAAGFSTLSIWEGFTIFANTSHMGKAALFLSVMI